MRLDKFLDAVNIVKKRSIASDMIKSGAVFLNGAIAKASKEVKVGDEIEIKYLNGNKKFRVLQIPNVKNIPKKDKDKYIKILE